MLCKKKRRTYNITQDACITISRRSKKDNQDERSLKNMTIMTLCKNRNRKKKPSKMVLPVTEDTPADMFTGSMELLVELPHDHHVNTQKITVLRSTPMMDLLIQIATTHKLMASSYILQAIGERGIILPHHPNTPIGALDALKIKLLPKQGTYIPHKTKPNQPFETTFRLQVHLPKNQLYVARVSPKMNLGEILDKVCHEKNLDKSKYELRHPVNLEEKLDLSLSLQDYHLQELILYAKQIKSLGPTLSTQDIMALQRQEERRRQQTKQGLFGFTFKKSKESSLSTDSLGARSVSPARSDETTRSISPLQPPTRPQRKRRQAPKPPTNVEQIVQDIPENNKDKMTINHSRNSSDSSGYHEASVLSDNPDSNARLPETLPRRNKASNQSVTPRKLAQTSQSSKSLGNLEITSEKFSQGICNTLNSTGFRKKRAAPLPPISRPLSSAVSAQILEHIVDSKESQTHTSNIESPKSPSDSGVLLKASSDISINTPSIHQLNCKIKSEITTCEINCDVQQNCTTEANIEACLKSDLSNTKEEQIANNVETTLNAEEVKKDTSTSYQDTSSIETDILLQKVSDTLSNVPILSSPKQSLPVEINNTTEQINISVLDGSAIKLESTVKNDQSSELYKSCIENDSNTSTLNIIAADLQQNTSDYISAKHIDENSLINDWEYQLPAPPSAFRDSHSPVFDNYDITIQKSEQESKEPINSLIMELTNETDSNDKNSKLAKNVTNDIEINYNEKALKEKIDFMSQPKTDIEQTTNKATIKQAVTTLQKSKTDSNLRKEMISELENKIETGILSQPVNKDFDRRNIDSLSTPELAPVDNTLSNFTITTYTKRKDLDIFEEFEKSSDYAKNSEERFIKTFATLSRNNTDTCNHDKKSTKKNTHLINNLSHKLKDKSEELTAKTADYKVESKIHDQNESFYKWQSFNVTNDKTNIQRSKSYISMSNNIKYQKEGVSTKTQSQIKPETICVKKTTSITDLNDNTLKINEKFSQWRENILKNQEEPTKEKQLQSLQVLKNILPQLKNAQQAEEDVSKDYNNTSLIQTTYNYGNEHSNEHSIKENKSLTKESQRSLKSDYKLLKEKSIERYVYNSPPMINLGSWSERPSVNVQIKKDTDYKLGRSNTINGNKTVVNVDSTKNKKDPINLIYVNNNNDKNNIINHEFDSMANKNSHEITTKKLVIDMEAPNFKISNQIDPTSDLIRNEDKPVVMGVELKKTSMKTSKEMLKNIESEIDTTPMNFKELTKTFSQYENFEQKSRHSNINRFSVDYHNVQPSETEKIANSNIKENDCIWLAKTNQNFSLKNQAEMHVEHNAQTKKFTSVIGVNETKQNLRSQNEILHRYNVNNGIKINPLPVVKGFKISTTDSMINNKKNYNRTLANADFNKSMQSSKSPTIPVITGVMLKSASTKPKSMAVQLDHRDMLLESIRNFGGREKLRNVSIDNPSKNSMT